MAIQVNPNRMELLRLKKRQQIAVRGHSLLKDKLEGLLRDFMGIVGRYKDLRRRTDDAVVSALGRLVLSSAALPREIFTAAMAFPTCVSRLDVDTRSIMNVRVPAMSFTIEGDLLSYGMAFTDAGLDAAMEELRGVLRLMVELAEVEKTVELVALEIQKTRRRVNALEYMLIPQQEEAIHAIEAKLDELDRANITRLMKIKQLLGI
jgi:V/A-type H+-transporting ATPase subunit D